MDKLSSPPGRESALSSRDPAELDSSDPVPALRDHFWVPSPTDLEGEHICDPNSHIETRDECTYLCGNSLGLAPKETTNYVTDQLRLWQAKGVYGHFKKTDSRVPSWVSIDEHVQAPIARIVGALPSEVVVMQTLSANLHLLLSCFYKPTSSRYKIILEAKSFPSDHFIVESQLRHHGVDVTDGMVLLHPPSDDSPCLPTEHILREIDAHAAETALVMLPGIQFYTGQLFDIERITAHAHSKGIIIGWDLAHAAGNVPLQLHDWDVDFAAWCNYKYMNAGPGAIGSLFVHSRHTDVPKLTVTDGEASFGNPEAEKPGPRPHLQGWWGSTKASRFTMDNRFEAIPGAAGFQLSNPSALDISALMGSLSVFEKTSMSKLRDRSLRLTGYLEALLLAPYQREDDERQNSATNATASPPYKIITPSDPTQRGAQLSIRLPPSLLEPVATALERQHIVVDERKPDVIRVAPAPLYNTFQDCKRFVDVFQRACIEAVALDGKKAHDESIRSG